MEHMVKQITNKQIGWAVDTQCGTFFVPGHVQPVPAWLRTDEEIHDNDWEVFKIVCDLVRDYVPVDMNMVIYIEAVRGYFGRWSAPGYTDATEWVYGSTKRDVAQQLNQY